MLADEMRETFFPHFQEWIDFLLRQAASSLPVTKHRLVACVIGAAYQNSMLPKHLKDPNGTEVIAFIRSPRDVAKSFKIDWPESKGRWIGPRGYPTQFKAATEIVKSLRM
jgi:hypothetical protein